MMLFYQNFVSVEKLMNYSTEMLLKNLIIDAQLISYYFQHQILIEINVLP